MKNIEAVPANTGKQVLINIDGTSYGRFPLKTHVITKNDNIVDVCDKYASPYLKKTDVLFVSEKVVAISQGRSFHINDIHPSSIATYLSRFVHKSKHGIGLGSPYTMQLAIQQAGLVKILAAAAVSALTKPIGVKGIFYMIAGNDVNAIDGPCSFTIPPYNEFAKLPPAFPNVVAKRIKQIIGCEVVIIDANDLGVNVLGRSSKVIRKSFCRALFQDNPLGQGKEQTPLCLVRAIGSI